MDNLSILIKPSSSLCDLNCKYCFYHSLSENNRKTYSYGFMNNKTIETIVMKSFKESKRSVSFCFQGGEPTLCGLDFYKNLISLVEKYNTKKIIVNYAIQTNGIQLDDKWCEFLCSNNFLVGISLDGPKDIHDLNRIYKNGKGSYNNVIKSIELMKKYNVQFNILTVVTSTVARHIEKIYKFFTNSGFRYLQFIPCLDKLGDTSDSNLFSLSKKNYEAFLLKLFDLYYRDFMNDNFVSVRYFDNLVSMILGHQPESCNMNGICTIQYVIEGDGTVFPCDFYCTDEWMLGNINSQDFFEIYSMEKAEKFISFSKNPSKKCPECKYYSLCRGGCRRTREPIIDGILSDQKYCESYYSFFEKSTEKLSKIAHIVSTRNNRYH